MYSIETGLKRIILNIIIYQSINQSINTLPKTVKVALAVFPESSVQVYVLASEDCTGAITKL